MDDEDSNHDSDQGDQTDREEESDGEDTVTENEGESEDADNVDLMEGGVLEKRTQENGKEAGTGEGTRSLGGKGRGVGKKPRKRGVPLFDWQV